MDQRLRLIQGSGARPDKRQAERKRIRVPGQIAWKDARGRSQVAAVVTADVSERGVRIEPRGSVQLPLYRLVYFQVDRLARQTPDLPDVLRKSNVLSAVFRVGVCSQETGTPGEYGLRLLVEPAASTAAQKTA
jgi:hypothetical protein